MCFCAAFSCLFSLSSVGGAGIKDCGRLKRKVKSLGCMDMKEKTFHFSFYVTRR